MKSLITARQSQDTLQTYYDNNNGRLPTKAIPDEVIDCGSFSFITMRMEKMENTNEFDLIMSVEGKKIYHNGKLFKDGTNGN